MRKDCDTCLHDEFGETYCNNCYWANGKPPTKWEPAPFWTPDTNADRIRAMSDDGLAKWISDMWHGFVSKPWCDFRCQNCREGDDCRCEKCALEWLKQPAKGE